MVYVVSMLDHTSGAPDGKDSSVEMQGHRLIREERLVKERFKMAMCPHRLPNVPSPSGAGRKLDRLEPCDIGRVIEHPSHYSRAFVDFVGGACES